MYSGKKVRQQRKSPRLNDFNYTMPGYYFVTICTKNKISYFGDVYDYKMLLNNIGRIVQKIWQSIPDHYPDVMLDEFVIMPNHIHGIIIIKENAGYKNVGTGHRPVQLQRDIGGKKRTGRCPVPTDKNYGLLSKIINAFKSMVSREIKRKNTNCNFAWQRFFHDHVIRSEKGLQQIRSYINNNPMK
ncbi:MAG: transposase [Candidatus Zixiibacteriota bacterium]